MAPCREYRHPRPCVSQNCKPCRSSHLDSSILSFLQLRRFCSCMHCFLTLSNQQDDSLTRPSLVRHSEPRNTWIRFCFCMRTRIAAIPLDTCALCNCRRRYGTVLTEDTVGIFRLLSILSLSSSKKKLKHDHYSGGWPLGRELSQLMRKGNTESPRMCDPKRLTLKVRLNNCNLTDFDCQWKLRHLSVTWRTKILQIPLFP